LKPSLKEDPQFELLRLNDLMPARSVGGLLKGIETFIEGKVGFPLRKLNDLMSPHKYCGVNVERN